MADKNGDQPVRVGATRYLAAATLVELGGTAKYAELVAKIASALQPTRCDAAGIDRARQYVYALRKLGFTVQDGAIVRLERMPGPPLTPVELAERKRQTAAQDAARRQAARANRIPPPDDQDDDEIVLGVGKFADWTPRSLIAAGELRYLCWFVSLERFRTHYPYAWRAAAQVLGEYLLREARRWP